jgi:hypothetical protein
MKTFFPMVGMPDVHGIRGMFIGEEHHEPMYLTRFLMCLRTLSSHIDVLFLEMYNAGQVAPTSSLAAVQRAIGRTIEYSFGWEPDPRHYLRLAQEAKILGLPVRGIDVPEAFESDTLTKDEEDALRDSSLFHDIWREALILQMRQIFGPGSPESATPFMVAQRTVQGSRSSCRSSFVTRCILPTSRFANTSA